MSGPFIRSRPTIYKGIRMRSRLEAAHAQFLDGRGVRWEYEPMCFAGPDGQYLPDFRLKSPQHPTLYIEVKPNISASFEQLGEIARRMEIILWSEPLAELAVVMPTERGFAMIARFREWQEGQRCWDLPAHPSDLVREGWRSHVPAALRVRAEP